MKRQLLNIIRQSPVVVTGKVVLAALLLGVGLWSCDKKEETQGIVLVAPADNATFDLSTTNKITFSWDRAEGVSAYTLRFSESATEVATGNVKKELGDATSYDLTAAEADQLMRQYTNVAPGAMGTIYWTVTGGDAQTQVRKFTIKRLPAVDGAFVSVSEHNLTFTESGNTQTVTITSNTTWGVDITQEGSWLSVSPQGGTGNGAITFTALPNTTNVARTATVTIFGAGADYPENISVLQAAQGGGDITAMYGTWHLKKAESIYSAGTITVTGEFLKEAQFTLNEDRSWTGEILVYEGDWSDSPNPTRTWTYEGGIFSFTEGGNEASWRATPGAEELVLEVGQAGQGGYAKAVYTRTPNTVPPMPQPADITPYTGAESVFIGEWALIKQEYCTSYNANGSDPFWENTYFKAADNVIVYTINANHTYSIEEFGEDTPSTGTWSYNAATGEISVTPAGGGNVVYKAESATNATTIVWGRFSADEDYDEYEYERVTLTKKN